VRHNGSSRVCFRVALLLCLTTAVWAQNSNSENPTQDSAVAIASTSSSVYSADTSSDPSSVSSSLADVARQTRDQHARENVKKAQEAGSRDWDEPITFQICDDAICPSIRLTEDVVVRPATPSVQNISKPISTASLQDTFAISDSSGEPSSSGPSLSELARQTRQSLHKQLQLNPAQAKLDGGEGVGAVPEGFQSLFIQYCLNPQICSEGSVLIPENAEVVSRVNSQYVFKIELNGEAAMLYAGPADVNAPYRSMTDPDFIRMRNLGNANGWSHEKAASVSTQEAELDGKHSVITRFRYPREEKRWWVGERALIEMDDVQFLAACTAPEENFAALEGQCATLMNSLRLP
jgi:hypothetical protein